MIYWSWPPEPIAMWTVPAFASTESPYMPVVILGVWVDLNLWADNKTWNDGE